MDSKDSDPPSLEAATAPSSRQDLLEKQQTPANVDEKPELAKETDGVVTVTDAAELTEPQSDPQSEPQSKTEEEDEIDYVTGYKRLAIAFATVLVIFMVLLDTSIVGTAVPRITSEFHSLNDVGWYGGAYQLASASLQPLTGKFYTHFHTKWTYLCFVFVFEVGSAVCGSATSSTAFIIGRAVAGLGASGIQNGSLTMIADAIPMKERAMYMGMLMGFVQLGILCGPLVGGAFTQYTTWRWCFYLNLPIGVFAMVFIFLMKVPQHTKKHPFTLAGIRSILPELDLLGFVLFAPTSIMILLALEWGGNTYPWNSATVIGLFCGGGALAIVFSLWEWHMGDRAMIPGSLVTRRVVWASCFSYMFLMCTVFVVAQFMPIYFQSVKGVNPSTSGVDMLPAILSQLVAAVFSGFSVSKIGYPMIFASMAAIGSSIGAGLVSTLTVDTPTAKWAGYQIILGFFRGMGMQMGVLATQAALPHRLTSMSMSVLVFGQNFGAAVFIAIGNAIFDAALTSKITSYAPSVSPTAALLAGGDAQAVRDLVPEGSPELAGVLLAYAESFDYVMYMVAAVAAFSILPAVSIGPIDVRQKAKKDAKTKEAKEEKEADKEGEEKEKEKETKETDAV